MKKLAGITHEARGAIPLVPVAKRALKDWLAARPARERRWVEGSGFRADAGRFVFLPDASGKPARVLVGADVAAYRTWALAALPDALPEGHYRLDAPLDAEDATRVSLGWALGAYRYTRYKAAKRAPARLAWPGNADRREVTHLAQAVMLARDLVNTPAEDMGPADLAAAVQSVADESGAECRILSGDALLKEGYRTVHAVGRAASRAPCLADLRWGDPKAPKVTLVGKGVCFDTGGLDLKPASGMLQMKKDMGGAAIVLGLAQALMAARAPIRLRVLIPAVENAVSGNALRPRDVIRTKSGKTVEIGNTDAEGRLILCDALWEADREKPALLVDCATLTGAARVALGPEVQALFSNDDALASALVQAGREADDPLWQLPLWKGYRRQLDSPVADLNNVSASPFAGAIIAALYLAEFVKPSTPWAHLDVYASNPSTRPGRPEGGEATGLRALYRAILARYR